MNNKRLFALRHRRKGPLVMNPETRAPWYFSNKMDAKRVRDSLGGETVVTLGPDHFRMGGDDE